MGSFRRPAALSLTVLIHAGLILALTQIRGTVVTSRKETIISLVPAEALIAPPSLAAPSIRFETPIAATVAAPKIVVDEAGRAKDADSNGKAFQPHLPPRLDPRESNAPPALPVDLRERLGTGQAYIVIVRALVLENGRVGNDELVASSGSSELDALALAQVREHWRFVPATLNGNAVSDWLSVEVLFKPA